MKPNARHPAELPVLTFRAASQWLAWLDRNHAGSPGVWLKIAKQGGGQRTLTYKDALEAALCYGWIDGQKKGFDDRWWLQKFVRRRPGSIWSKVNREHAQRLIESGQMKAAGLEAIERAKASGQWDAAYDSQRGMTVPEDLQAELHQRPAARKFFEELNSINRYAILHRIQTARKPETRARRIQKFVEMLEKREKIYP